MPLVGLTGGVCTPKRKNVKAPVVDAVWFQAEVPALAPCKQSAHVSPQTHFLIMSRKHLFQLKKITGFWFNPRATEYLLSIPSHLKPPDPHLEALKALQVKKDLLQEVLESLPELSPVIPEDPYRQGFRDGHKDLRRFVLHLLAETKKQIQTLQIQRSAR